jgi:hypothetical protein
VAAAAHCVVDALHVDLGGEPHAGRLVGVALAAVDVHVVDAAVVRRVAGADDRAVPRVHVHVVRVGHAVRDGAIADALLALLELLEQTEAPRHDCMAGRMSVRGPAACRGGRAHGYQVLGGPRLYWHQWQGFSEAFEGQLRLCSGSGKHMPASEEIQRGWIRCVMAGTGLCCDSRGDTGTDLGCQSHRCTTSRTSPQTLPGNI